MGVGKAKIDSKWRIVLPASVREGFQPGDEVLVIRQGQVITIRKAIDPLRLFNEVKLFIPDDKAYSDVSEVKHYYGARKD